jgi:hypothetical protein
MDKVQKPICSVRAAFLPAPALLRYSGRFSPQYVLKFVCVASIDYSSRALKGTTQIDESTSLNTGIKDMHKTFVQARQLLRMLLIPAGSIIIDFSWKMQAPPFNA